MTDILGGGEPTLVDRTWHFPDGSTVPLVAGGSDVDLNDFGPPDGGFGIDDPGGDFNHVPDPNAGGEPPSQPGGGQPAPSTPAAPTPGQPPAGGQPAPAPQSFATVEQAVAELGKVRQEAAGYRVQLRDFERDFGNLHPDDRSAMAGFVNAYRSGNFPQMMSWILENGRIVAQQMGKPWEELALGGQPPAGGQPAPGAAPGGQPAPQPVDFSNPDAFNKAVAAQVQEGIKTYHTEQEAARATKEAGDHILDVMGKRGYDVRNPDGQHILFLIRTMNDRDVSKAIDEYERLMDEQAVSYAQKKATQAAAAAGTAPAGAAPSGAVDPNADEPDPMKRAEKNMNRRLDAVAARRRQA